MFNKILVALDGSELAGKILRESLGAHKALVGRASVPAAPAADFHRRSSGPGGHRNYEII